MEAICFSSAVLLTNIPRSNPTQRTLHSQYRENIKSSTLIFEEFRFSHRWLWSDLLFLISIVGGGVQLGPLGTAATIRPIVPAPGDYDDGETGGMIGSGNRSTGRKPSPVPLCPLQTPHAARTRTRAAAVGSQRLNAWATARPKWSAFWNMTPRRPLNFA
jgi:hypothetical protein